MDLNWGVGVVGTKILRMSRQPFPLQIMTDQKKKKHGRMEDLNCLDSVITSGARCTREITSRTDMAKVTFNKKETLFATKQDLYLRKKLVNCYIWSAAVSGAETWAVLKADQKDEGYRLDWACGR